MNNIAVCKQGIRYVSKKDKMIDSISHCTVYEDRGANIANILITETLSLNVLAFIKQHPSLHEIKTRAHRHKT